MADPAQLAQLIEQMKQGRANQARLTGLDEQYANAQARSQALRGGMAESVQTGGVAGGLANVLRGYTASQQTQNLQPQRAALRQEVAGTQDAATIYKFQRELEKEKADAGLEKELQVLKNTGATAKLAEKQRLKKEYALWAKEQGVGQSSKTLSFPEWKKRRDATVHGQKSVIDHQKAATLEGINATAEAKGQTFAAPTAAETKAIEGYGGESKRFHSVMDQFKTRFGGSGLGYEEWRNQFMRSYATLAKGVGVGQDAFDSEAWFASLQQFVQMPERHEIAGATLTPHEMKEWKAALTPQPNMTAEQILKRIDTLLKYDKQMTDHMRVNQILKGRKPSWIKHNLGSMEQPESANVLGTVKAADMTPEQVQEAYKQLKAKQGAQ